MVIPRMITATESYTPRAAQSRLAMQTECVNAQHMNGTTMLPRADPAVEAAQRAWEKNKLRLFHVQRVAAAREALTPIRELHRSIRIADDYAYCGGCDEQWPCATAKLIYPTEEL